MTDKTTMEFIKQKVIELGLRDKMDFFHWLMHIVLQDLNADVAGETKYVETT